jgi:hypothetical protein
MIQEIIDDSDHGSENVANIRSDLLVETTGVPGENHRPAASH